MKPRIFIGSSAESLEIAEAVQRNLDHHADVEVWTQGIFGPSLFPLEALLGHLDKADFGIFVFTPLDRAWIRGTEYPTIRDNVLLEAGLFLGRLGRDRCYVLTPRGADFHLPSDLSGFTPLTYKAEQALTNPDAALSSACSAIRMEIGKWRQTPPASVAKMFAHVKESPQFGSFLDRSTKEMLVVGPSLLYIATNCHDHVFARARAGVACKFLINADSHSDSAFHLIQDYGSAKWLGEELDLVHRHFRDWLEDAAKEGLDIQVRVAPLVPIGMNFVDGSTDEGQLLLIPLPYRTPGADRPCFLLEKLANPSAFSLYYNKTIDLWNNSGSLR